ncbi:hypothetical protein K438DRAFT_1785875 [Mycena galopus ATCC 62051]|nr:hypothetical protein K438DRAFT_1785875 [Mycena galopus ATCC 62051]
MYFFSYRATGLLVQYSIVNIRNYKHFWKRLNCPNSQRPSVGGRTAGSKFVALPGVYGISLRPIFRGLSRFRNSGVHAHEHLEYFWNKLQRYEWPIKRYAQTHPEDQVTLARVQCPVHSSLLHPLAEDVLDFVFKVEDIPGGVVLDVLLGPAAALLDVALVELPPEFGEDVVPEAGSESDPSSPILECGATFSE